MTPHTRRHCFATVITGLTPGGGISSSRERSGMLCTVTTPPHAQHVASQPCCICQHPQHVVVEGRLQDLMLHGARASSPSAPWLTLVTCLGCGVTDFFAEPERLTKLDGATIVSVPGAPA